MVSNNIVLDVADVELRYKFFKANALKHTLLRREKRKVQVFEALKGISFQVQQGINLGVIGSNGSGKSTLLRILAHTLIPDKGKVTIKAKSISLLSLGVGFKQDLSGYENIYLNGLLLGLSRKQLDNLVDKIIDFSELEKFISNPVRTYSSGMKSKLSFSIAVNVNPELLLIDEIFSVGDVRFQEKSRKKIESMIQDDRTVVMVSHNMETIRQHCHKVLWLEEGIAKEFGSTDEVISDYLEYMK